MKFDMNDASCTFPASSRLIIVLVMYDPVACLFDTCCVFEKCFILHSKCEPIHWVGVFGSFNRHQQKRSSNIDMIIGFTPEIDKLTWEWKFASHRFVTRGQKLFGNVLELLPLDPETQSIENHDTLAGLLTCVTVYGPQNWHHCARTKARFNARRRLRTSFESLTHRESD